MLVLSGVLDKTPERTSMSTSLLYHAFGVRGYHYQRTHRRRVCETHRLGCTRLRGRPHKLCLENGAFHTPYSPFAITQPREGYRCAVCGSADVIGQIRMLIQSARTLRIHALGILADYDYPISTGPLEGTNNKIKTMKRQTSGFRDPEFLKLTILGIHETKHALVGCVSMTWRSGATH